MLLVLLVLLQVLGPAFKRACLLAYLAPSSPQWSYVRPVPLSIVQAGCCWERAPIWTLVARSITWLSRGARRGNQISRSRRRAFSFWCGRRAWMRPSGLTRSSVARLAIGDRAGPSSTQHGPLLVRPGFSQRHDGGSVANARIEGRVSRWPAGRLAAALSADFREGNTQNRFEFQMFRCRSVCFDVDERVVDLNFSSATVSDFQMCVCVQRWSEVMLGR